MHQDNQIANKLAQLNAEFKQKLPSRINRLVFLWNGLRYINWKKDMFLLFKQEVHKLAGAAGSFGFEKVGSLAKEAEMIASKYDDVDKLPSEVDTHQLSKVLETLQSLISQSDQQQALHKPQLKVRTRSEIFVFLVDDDQMYSEFIKLKLAQAGIKVECFASVELALEANKQHKPDLYILDIDLEGKFQVGTSACAAIRQANHAALPIIFATAHEDFKSRLAATRAGGNAYMTKPVDIGEMVNIIRGLASAPLMIDCKVLVIDDDKALAEAYCLQLQKYGVQTRYINDPIRSMYEIKLFQPDIVLLDINLPNCSGIEVAQILRLESSLLGLGIIFISANPQQDIHFNALKLGVFDCLTKPLAEQQLVAAIQSYVVMRQRMIEKAMSNRSIDPETGLATQSCFLAKFKEYLANNRQAADSVLLYVDIEQAKGKSTEVTLFEQELVLGKAVAELLPENAIGCRWNGQGYMLYLCEKLQADSIHLAKKIIEQLQQSLAKYADTATVKIHCGVSYDYLDSQVNDVIEAAIDAQRQAQSQHQTLELVSIKQPKISVPKDSQDKLISLLAEKQYSVCFHPVISIDHSQKVQPLYLSEVLLGDSTQVYAKDEFEQFVQTEKQQQELLRWTITEVTKKIAEHLQRESQSVQVQIDVSPLATRYRDFLIWLSGFLKEQKIRDPSTIIFSFDQQRYSEYGESGAFFVNQIRHLGFHLAIANFGCNNYSEHMLAAYKPQFVRLNQEDSAQISKQAEWQAQLNKQIDLARRHDAIVIAENMLDAAMMTTLWQAGVRFFQGDFFEDALKDLTYNFENSIAFA